MFIFNPNAYDKHWGTVVVLSGFMYMYFFLSLYIVNVVSKHMYIILIEKKKENKKSCAYNYSHATVYFESFFVVLGYFLSASFAKHFLIRKASFLRK